jgi:hypothetical protein
LAWDNRLLGVVPGAVGAANALAHNNSASAPTMGVIANINGFSYQQTIGTFQVQAGRAADLRSCPQDEKSLIGQ